MRDYCLLLRLNLRNRLAAFKADSWRKENGKMDWGRLIGTVVVILAFGALAVGLVYGEIKLFGLLATFRQQALLPALAVLMSLASTLILCFFHVLSSLYFSRDTGWMAYLPVKSRSVMAAKMTEVWMGEELFAAAILLPIFILYGINLGADALYYVRMVLIVMLTPLLPLSIVGLLTSLLASSTSLVRHKEALTVVMSIVLMVGIWGLEAAVLPKIPDDADAVYLLRLLLDNEGVLTMLTSGFPPVLWAVHAVQGNWLELGLYALVSLGSVAILFLLVGKSYLNVCLKQGEHATRKRKLKIGTDTWKQRSPLMALFRKEWTAIIKNPTVAFNCLPSIIILPVIVIMVLAGMASSINLGQFLEGFRELVAEFNALDNVLIMAAVVTFSSFMNPAVATAISREGARLEISRMIPVDARTQVNAKLLVGMLIDVLAVAVGCVMIGVLLPEQVLLLIPAGVLALLVCFAESAMSLTLDALRPNLTWSNETQLVKQSANVAFGMLIGLALFALPIVPAVMLKSPVLRFAAAGGVILAEAAVGYILLRKVAVGRFARLEPAN